jgi:hypothetical protein
MKVASGRALARFALALTLLGPARVMPAGEFEPALWSRLDRIESAFRNGDAQALRASLPENAKVRVDLRTLADGPVSYGPGQLQVVLDHIFHDQPTREFVLPRRQVKVSSPGTAFASGRWVRGRRPGAPDALDLVTMTLREDGGDWHIYEILCSR